ncbi:SGNH/GDSL hydrolase family protein [Chitinophaga lutea]|uniref:SGNH/GDSL hydrolase family protein n=1 Tax=Chitinophaga lutea TaxID=2488634 RepID=A0A3N4Q4S4_9BACT|nr:GDSL-type esterase/lipase family protein [Chitinophaga lutea]RPE12481.1 SGNH/GDSL hydrolase family protein [Chitinophaga lutea]
MKPQTWLALGDSYTIGEGVPLHDSYPYQALQMLRAGGRAFHAPEIVARTAWTSHELIAHVQQIHLQPTYDYVSLLIGVNDQYRGLKEDDYESSFEWLAEKALLLTRGLAAHVTVLSIPDWGVTPYAAGRDTHAAIDRHNAINRNISTRKGFHYIDITEEYRRTGGLAENVVEDGLHPSAAVYRRWAEALVKNL